MIRLPAIATMFLFSLLTLGVAPMPRSIQPGAGATRLVIDFPDGTQVHYKDIKLKTGEESTVLDVLHAAGGYPEPRRLSIECKGSGAMTLVTKIGELANERGGSDAKCWQYWINDQYAKQGAGAALVKPGDRVTWGFMAYSSPPPARPE